MKEVSYFLCQKWSFHITGLQRQKILDCKAQFGLMYLEISPIQWCFVKVIVATFILLQFNSVCFNDHYQEMYL